MRAIPLRQCPVQSRKKCVWGDFYYAQVTNDELKDRKGSDLQGTKWTQPTNCLVLWAVELIEE